MKAPYYNIICKDSKKAILSASTIEQANIEIKALEELDKKEGFYIPDFYDIEIINK